MTGPTFRYLKDVDDETKKTRKLSPAEVAVARAKGLEEAARRAAWKTPRDPKLKALTPIFNPVRSPEFHAVGFTAVPPDPWEGELPPALVCSGRLP